MDLAKWVKKSIAKSKAIIVNLTNDKWEHLMLQDDVYYYGDKVHICPATHITNILDYFVSNEQK
jgi:predicted ATP-dependent protease